jgi:2-dehydro-3-deoxyglucarate aldolase/4-hydroxy-2-oxoheptanedioate aldolase
VTVPAGLRGPGPTTFGTWVKLPSLETLELLAAAGFEFVVVDMEHSPLTLDFAYQAIVVAQGLGLAVLVRVPDRSGSHLQRLLDAGADGILVPQVASAAEARRSVEQMVFSPAGRRGMGSTSRAGRWGLATTAEYLATGDQVVRAIQIEDAAAFDELDAILDTPGLTAVFLGMGDLSLSSGRPASSPELQELMDRLLAAAAARQLPCGTAVGEVCRKAGVSEATFYNWRKR